ncbi:MAG: polyisoprenyl-phosphate glycosyltransferase [Solirubrobacteraceae bacterium]|jgi:dolichol-phosphate mannosyltransferase|nr:polyisoprenyl-phosphate glycosyltransferase [Solirubrobacteraceae bacterium]
MASTIKRVAERHLGLLSIVAPMLDEEGTARAFCERVRSALDGLPWELVVVDDGSQDETPQILAELACADERIKVVTLSRNFGHQTAITAGLDHAAGDVVVMIDSDLQDPPELVPTMLEHWRAGSDVVYAMRTDRSGESRFKLATASWFYRIMSKVSDVPLAQNSGDFRLLDRRALDALLAMRESNRYLRGMTSWIGFTQTAVPYHRDARHAGVTKYPIRKMIRFALDAIASFSHAPLQIATVAGFAFAFLAFLAIPVAIIFRIFGAFVPGVTTTVVAVLLLGGIQLMAIGMIGEYVGRIYDEVKRRPLYVVRDRANVAAAATEDEHEHTPA